MGKLDFGPVLLAMALSPKSAEAMPNPENIPSLSASDTKNAQLTNLMHGLRQQAVLVETHAKSLQETTEDHTFRLTDAQEYGAWPLYRVTDPESSEDCRVEWLSPVETEKGAQTMVEQTLQKTGTQSFVLWDRKTGALFQCLPDSTEVTTLKCQAGQRVELSQTPRDSTQWLWAIDTLCDAFAKAEKD